MNSIEIPPDGLRLHIGGQAKLDGWKILDALPGPIVDFVGNCNDLSFLPDESCSEVYASHVLEHLGYNGELQGTLRGIVRVLRPGGRLRASVPDLEVLCRLFLHPELNVDQRFDIMRMMFGGRTTPFDIHHAGLTAEFLARFMRQAGFSRIDRVKEFGLLEDTSTFRVKGILISANLEARK